MTSSKWKHFPRYWPFVWAIHRSPVNCPHKGQWHGALMFSLICAWINNWVNSREDGDLRRHRAHYDIIVTDCPVCPHMISSSCLTWATQTSKIPSAICLTCHHIVPKATAAKGRTSTGAAKYEGLVESAIGGWKRCKRGVQVTAWSNGTIQDRTDYFCNTVIKALYNMQCHTICAKDYAHSCLLFLLWFATCLFAHIIKVDSWHFMMTSSNGNIFRFTGHLCGEFTGPRWIPHTKASDAEIECFLWYASE